jgi:mRNA-degrading endonuclease toxin of MazEF toxin-antitoxin module
MEILRGGIYFAALPNVGDKAVLVLSWDAINVGLRSPIVCQVTTRERERSLPTFVPLPAGAAGIEADSYILCHELVTLDAEDFRREVGMVPPAILVQVEDALRRALDL